MPPAHGGRQVSPRGLSLYRRLGYKERGVFRKFVLKPK